MLRKIRILLASVCFTLVTLLFLDFTGTIHLWFSWLAKIQFLPALLALNVGVVIGLIALTLLFGRIYCSVICPLGVLQDFFIWLGGRKNRNRFQFKPANSILRCSALGVFVLLMAAGLGSIAALIAPYSAFGRIAGTIFRPVYLLANNGLAYLAERADSYAFYSVDIWITGGVTLAAAALTLIALAIFSYSDGRIYCNSICPVGTVLGFLSRFAVFKPVIDTEKCVSCGLCAKNCKSSCIDIPNAKIDLSRCVACMDCLSVCRMEAIHLGITAPQKQETQSGKTQSSETQTAGAQESKAAEVEESQAAEMKESQTDTAPESAASSNAQPSSDAPKKEGSMDVNLRRAFLTAVTLTAANSALAQVPGAGGSSAGSSSGNPTQAAPRKKSAGAPSLVQEESATDGGLAPLEEKRVPRRKSPITPPGSVSLRNLTSHCTACQLCVSVCPNHVLRPSDNPKMLMMPEVSYEHGYCRPECVRCTQVCPTGAINLLDVAAKSATRIGLAVWRRGMCVVQKDGVSCGNCARHCPTKAIQMVPKDPNDPKSLEFPVVDPDRCIGCGACENLCPTRPFSAIYVEGLNRHIQD